MNAKISAIATIISLIIPMGAACYILLGDLFFFEFMLISLSTFILMIKISLSTKKSKTHQEVVAPYILSIVLSLITDTARFWSDYAAELQANHPEFFAPNAVFTPDVWFYVYITLLISLFLFGGYLLIKGNLLGIYLAWWLFIFNICEALLQLYVEFSSTSYQHNYYSGCIFAIIAAIVGVIGCKRLIRSRGEHGTA